jgi:tetraacyldisaccharide 4'-kinase
MNLENLYYKIIEGERKLYYAPALAILRAASIIYDAGLRLRRLCYRLGALPTRRLGCRVISVGNLTLGGTGKTPMVMLIADILRRHGRKPAILSRGYGGRGASRDVNVVCDGKRVLLSSEIAGDEPVMMAKRLGNVPVLTGADRYLTGDYARRELGADTLILDDGFQYIGLRRDLNILLFDSRRPVGNGLLFPAGTLREPPRELRRADMICFTRVADEKAAPVIDPRLLAGIPAVKSALRLKALARLDTGEAVDPRILNRRNVAAFCGIAKPDDFRCILERYGARLVLYRSFPDHHVYAPGDLKAVERDALAAGAGLLLTTEKDAAKLRDAVFALPALQLAVDIEIVAGAEIFEKLVLSGTAA